MVWTGSGELSSRTAPPASPVTTVDMKMNRALVAVSHAPSSRLVPWTLTSSIFARSRWVAISAARWITQSGAAALEQVGQRVGVTEVALDRGRPCPALTRGGGRAP